MSLMATSGFSDASAWRADCVLLARRALASLDPRSAHRRSRPRLSRPIPIDLLPEELTAPTGVAPSQLENSVLLNRVAKMVKFVAILFLLLASGTSVSAMTQCGMASWYEAKGSLKAAHRSLPFGSKVEVENLDNGLTITVEINDRGPFVSGRIIDISKAAAEELDFVGDGVARVRISTIDGAKSSCR